MTENVQNLDTGSSEIQATEQVQTSNDVQADVSSHSAAEQAAQQAQAEKMLPSSQVSKIVSREVKTAVEKERKKLMAQYESQQQQTAPQTQTLGGMIQLTPEQLEQQIRAAANKMAQENYINTIASEFENKVELAKQEDPEFGELYEALNVNANPELVLMTRGMDNSMGVLKEIAKNPSKFANVLMLARSGAPKLAQIELQRISESLKMNEAAQKQPVAKEPLRQIDPTNVGVDNGDMTVSDFRKIFRG